MAVDLPYLPTYKNVPELFTRIASAKVPDTFTTAFLVDTIGLKASGDRPLINLLKLLGFLDNTSKPTSDYSTLKNPAQAPFAIGKAIRRAYGPLFAANESAQSLQAAELRGLVGQVSGADAGIVSKITGTLQSLLRLAKFDGPDTPTAAEEVEEEDDAQPGHKEAEKLQGSLTKRHDSPRPEFHFNIQVHLPANGTEETYLHIFNALRKAFSS
jgi:hypothetical protein